MKARGGLLMVAAVAAANLAGVAPAPVHAANQTHHVSIYSNLYSERVTYVSRGDTVVWTAIDQLHTVIADDGRFQYFPLRELDRGQQVLYTFLAEETVRYYCRVHGNRGGVGMSGTIVVGRGSPSSPPTGDPEIRSVPSPGYPTISSALVQIPPDSTVRVQPGVYRERVVVGTPGVTVTGTGTVPGDVVIEGSGERASGVVLAAPRTRVENLSVRGQTAEGIAVRGADGASVRDVRASLGGSYGIIVADSIDVVVERAVAAGRIAGITIKGCADCDVVVTDSVLETSRFGALIDNAGGVEVRGNVVRDNGTGVAVRWVVTAPGVLRGGVLIAGNRITENRRAGCGLGGTEFPVLSGVWIAGAAGDIVEENEIAGHEYGVLVTSFVMPSLGARIAGNAISDSEKADIAWDGVGAGVCFEGNGEAPSSAPPEAQTVYACSLPATIGVPEPTVLADLALYAVSGNTP